MNANNIDLVLLFDAFPEVTRLGRSLPVGSAERQQELLCDRKHF